MPVNWFGVIPKSSITFFIHIGNFHFIKENFGFIGKLVTGSGFEDAVFQAEVCSTGSLNGLLSGSHYNRAWAVHSAFTVLNRLRDFYFKDFLLKVDARSQFYLIMHLNNLFKTIMKFCAWLKLSSSNFWISKIECEMANSEKQRSFCFPFTWI